MLEFPDGKVLKGDRLLVATGRKPRLEGIGLENVGIEPGKRGIGVDARMSAGEGIWAIGDVTGIWPLTYVGKYQGRVAAANILGRGAEANYDAVPRVVFTDPQAVAVGEAEGEITVTVSLDSVPRTSTYYREYEDAGFLTLVSDGERSPGAYALGPEAGEWLGQATLAIRAQVPIAVLKDTIQPFPTFSEVYLLRDAGADRGRAGVDPFAALAANGLFLLFQVQRDRVDAVALTGRVRSVVEHVAEVAAAAGAHDLGAHHAVARVGSQLDGLGGGRLVEAGPARARLEFRIGAEQLVPARRAAVDAVFLAVRVLAREWRLGPLPAQDLVLLRRQLLLPLLVGLVDLRGHAIEPPVSGLVMKCSYATRFVTP